MAGVEGKGSTKLVHGGQSDEATIDLRGAIKVKLVPRGTAAEGYGSAQWLHGDKKDEVTIINGRVKVKVI